MEWTCVESSHANEAPSEAAEVGAAAPPTDVDTTGSSSEYVPQPVTTAPEDWAQNPYVQIEGGFLGGLMLGVVPFSGVGYQVLDGGKVLPHGTPEARLGLAVGQIVGGAITAAGGVTGEAFGGAATVTGLGAAVGVPALVVSTGLVVGGVGNIAAGVRGLSQSMMSKAPGSTGSQGTPTQDKILTKNEIRKLEDAGFDVHAEKGGKHTGRIDLYKRPDGEIVIKPKGGVGDGESTGWNINDLE